VDAELAKLQAIAPSLEGDLSAGYRASILKMAAAVDEALHAENQFLDECDSQHILPRLLLLSRQHTSRCAACKCGYKAPKCPVCLSLAVTVSLQPVHTTKQHNRCTAADCCCLTVRSHPTAVSRR
jgi:hypothetical protein